jgi:dynein light chain LC8-type
MVEVQTQATVIVRD